MKTKLKVLAVAVAEVLAIFSLAACGGGDGSRNSQDAADMEGISATDGQLKTAQAASPAATGNTLTVRARANLAGTAGGPATYKQGAFMVIIADGKVIGTVEVASTTFRDYSFRLPNAAVTKLDVVYNNDLNTAAGQDRNLFVESITINGQTILPNAPGVTFDRATADRATAFDGKDVLPGTGWLWWNGALRFPIAATPAPTGTSYYVDANAPNDLGTGTAASPKKYLSSGAALLSAAGGDTLIVKPGTYSNHLDDLGNKGSGRNGVWNVIKAEIDGTVKITAPFYMPKGDHYVQLEGLVWNSNYAKGISGRYVKILRCGFVGGPLVDNEVVLAIGGGSRTELGAQHVLMEDSYAFGAGGRYKVLVYNADKVVLRRVVARQEAGWLATLKDDEPSAAITLYNSTNVLTQNLLIVDSGGTPNFSGALFHPSNSSDTVSTSVNIRNVGAMVLNSDSGVAWDDYYPAVGMTLEDSVVINSGSDGVIVNGNARKQVKLRHVSVVGSAEKGVANYSNETNVTNDSDFTISDSIVAKSGTVAFGGTVGVQNVTSVAPQWPVKPVGANGATILKRLGKPGTLYGEVGYDAVQAEDLWPFPNEVAIKKAMCQNASPPVTTGLCAKPSLTHYVWEALGTPKP